MFQKCINKTVKTFLRNAIPKLYNVVSAPVAATQDAPAETLQSVRDTTSVLYNRMMENMGYGQQERLGDIVEKAAEEEKNQQLAGKKKKKPRNDNRMMMLNDMIGLKK